MAFTNHKENYEQVLIWISNSIDEVRNNINSISYPLFVYLYLDLSKKGDSERFFKTFSHYFCEHDDELIELAAFSEGVVSKYTKNKTHIYVPKIIFDVFLHFLTTENLSLILEIINKHFEISSLLSKIKQTNHVVLNLSADDLEKINSRTNIFPSKIKKDIDVNLNIKLNKKNKGEKTLLSKILIPIPEQYYDVQTFSFNTLKIDQTHPPTIGCFTVLNSHNKMNCCDISSDSGLIAVGLKDGQINLYLLDEHFPEDLDDDLIKEMEIYKDKYDKMLRGGEIFYSLSEPLGDLDEDNVANQAFEKIKKNRYTVLNGHSEAVLSVSFSPDNKYLVSGSFDESIRLWSLLTKETLVVYKGHFSPVLSVKFSPLTNYFASGGCDRTAKIWSISTALPLRQFSGHLSDVEIVEFHENGLYLATAANDKTVRLWCIESGECVRVFFNYSERGYVDSICFTHSGKLMVISSENNLIIYDVIKMGDPIRVIKNITNSVIYSSCFDLEDNVLSLTTQDNEILLFDFISFLNDDLPIQIELKNMFGGVFNDRNFMYRYVTKKTPVLVAKFTEHNLLLCVGRFDDNDPKIFM